MAFTILAPSNGTFDPSRLITNLFSLVKDEFESELDEAVVVILVSYRVRALKYHFPKIFWRICVEIVFKSVLCPKILTTC